MRYYEILYIINPNFEGDRLGAVIKEVNDTILGNEGVSIINHRVWGKKRLAYSIQNHKYGTYILLQFEALSGSFLKDFEMFLKLNKGIIRSQTIRLDEKPEEITGDEFIEDENEDSTEEANKDSENEDMDESDAEQDGDDSESAEEESSESTEEEPSQENAEEAEATDETKTEEASNEEATEEKTEE